MLLLWIAIALLPYLLITTFAVVDPWQVLLSTDASGARGSDRKTLELRASGEVSYKGRVFKSGKTRILFAFNHLDSFCIDDWRFLIKIDLPPETGTLYSRCRSHRVFDMILCQLDSISLPFWKGLSFITCCFTLMLFHLFIDRINRGGCPWIKLSVFVISWSYFLRRFQSFFRWLCNCANALKPDTRPI